MPHREMIQRYMTPSPHTIGKEQTLAAAHRMMREHHIRHLPVLHGGKLVGILSQRDLWLVETVPSVNPEELTVAEAMTEEPLTFTPRTLLKTVAREMAAHKYGAAVVVEEGKVLGIFTAVDALRTVVDLLEAKE